MSDDEGGRVFFARPRRQPDRDTEIVLVSVGVDIGSATTHLVFSRLVLRRRGTQTRLISSEVVHDSDILLTPYAEGQTPDAAGEVIDTEALGLFMARQYQKADIDPDMIDTGALILTGLAARKSNARAIGELFAHETGRFVAVVAGDALETTLSAHGAGAVAASAQDGLRVMNVDIGGGTSKIAICAGGRVADITALDIGARLICTDGQGAVSRIEPAGALFAEAADVALKIGQIPPEGALQAIADQMAASLFEAVGGAAMAEATRALHRLPPLPGAPPPDLLMFSGGVAEYIYGRESRAFGDLGPLLAEAVMARMRRWGPILRFGTEGIRATVVGAAQNTVQISGTTIYVHPPHVLPLQGLAVIAPDLPLAQEIVDPHSIATAIETALLRLDLTDPGTPVALFYRWAGSATLARLEAFCRGVGLGLAARCHAGQPLVLIGDGDVGGLIGLQCATELRLADQVVSIDGITLRDFDFCDIGAPLDASGALPVVIKSLVFPAPYTASRIAL